MIELPNRVVELTNPMIELPNRITELANSFIELYSSIELLILLIFEVGKGKNEIPN